jgi:hypothetical protein
MGVVAVGAKEIGPFPAGKETRPFSVKARPPVSVEIAMAFATKPVTLGKVDELSIEEPQFIPILRIMTVEAPSHRLCMMKLDVRMFVFQFSLFSIHFQRRVTAAAGKHPFCHGKRGYRKLLRDTHGRGREANPDQKNQAEQMDRFLLHISLRGVKMRD